MKIIDETYYKDRMEFLGKALEQCKELQKKTPHNYHLSTELEHQQICLELQISELKRLKEKAETFSDEEIEKLVWCYEVTTRKVQKDAYGIKEIIEKLKRLGGN